MVVVGGGVVEATLGGGGRVHDATGRLVGESGVDAV